MFECMMQDHLSWWPMPMNEENTFLLMLSSTCINREKLSTTVLSINIENFNVFQLTILPWCWSISDALDEKIKFYYLHCREIDYSKSTWSSWLHWCRARTKRPIARSHMSAYVVVCHTSNLFVFIFNPNALLKTLLFLFLSKDFSCVLYLQESYNCIQPENLFHSIKLRIPKCFTFSQRRGR